MKREFLYVMMAAAAMSSCSNDKVVDEAEGVAVSFRASLEKLNTRATEMTKSTLSPFKVTAVGTSTNYFTDVDVTSTDDGSSWSINGGTYYWPGEELQFFGYAPTSGIGTVTINNSTKQIAGFAPAANVANHVDLVASTSKKQSTGTVDMNFKHILSQIRVMAKCSDENVTIKVLGVKLGNIGSKGAYTFPTDETTSTYTWSTPWSLTANETASYMVGTTSESSAVTLTSDKQSIMFGDDNFFLIPQQLTAWAGTTATTGAYIGVLCNIKVKNGSASTTSSVQIYPNVADKYAFAAIPINNKWEPGKKYVYVLDFCGSGTATGGCGKVSPDQTVPSGCGVDFSSGDSGDSSSLLNATGVASVGTNIMGGTIKFNVTIDSWGDETEITVTM